jgi:hypothetical protein
MKISNKKQEKISEQIIAILFNFFPSPLFTSQIAVEMARDEEFIKKLLIILKNKQIVSEIKKNPKGIDYIKRSRWKLNEKVYLIYKNKQ